MPFIGLCCPCTQRCHLQNGWVVSRVKCRYSDANTYCYREIFHTADKFQKGFRNKNNNSKKHIMVVLVGVCLLLLLFGGGGLSLLQSVHNWQSSDSQQYMVISFVWKAGALATKPGTFMSLSQQIDCFSAKLPIAYYSLHHLRSVTLLVVRQNIQSNHVICSSTTESKWFWVAGV